MPFYHAGNNLWTDLPYHWGDEAHYPPIAFIFDMDGTLADIMRYHIDAWHQIFIALGLEHTRDYVERHAYGTNTEFARRMIGEHLSYAETEQIVVRKETAYRAIAQLAPIPGALSFLQQARQAGIPIALGTMADPDNIAFVLDGLAIRHQFDVVLGAADVTHGKPHPEIFLRAAEALHVPPEQCIVFEDAIGGVEAAQRAGMACVALTTTRPSADFAQFGNVVCTAPDFEALSLDELLVAIP